jgi:hypothetical protein
MPRAPSGPQPPSPATVIRAIFNDKRRLSERLSTDTRALTRAHLPLKIAHDQPRASDRARSFGRGQDRRDCARSSWLPWSLSVLSTAGLNVVDPALTALWPQDRSPGLQGPALPDMDFHNRASSNFSSNIVSESGSTNFVEDLVRLEAETAGDDLFLDLGGAPKINRNPAEARATRRRRQDL